MQIVTFRQKLKLSKPCEKQLQNHIRVVVWEKPLQKAPSIRKMTTFPKWPKLTTTQRAERLQNRHFGSKIKIVKTMRKTTLEPR